MDEREHESLTAQYRRAVVALEHSGKQLDFWRGRAMAWLDGQAEAPILPPAATPEEQAAMAAFAAQEATERVM